MSTYSVTSALSCTTLSASGRYSAKARAASQITGDLASTAIETSREGCSMLDAKCRAATIAALPWASRLRILQPREPLVLDDQIGQTALVVDEVDGQSV